VLSYPRASTHRFNFESADRIEQISTLASVPGIGPSAVKKLAHHRGGGPIRNLEELIRQYKACKGEASTYEQDNAFYMWLKVEKQITHSRHDITLAVSTRVLKMAMRAQ
jgi:DNA polymerase/3'-5' exonuclease PolX